MAVFEKVKPYKNLVYWVCKNENFISFKAVDGNLFILLNNLVEQNKTVFDDIAFIRGLILENCSIDIDGNFDILS
ncbi:hypothetical protein MXB_2274 [Myxobolus squamalis]|nr:hypothetical protein MXB_2274 [Myxobolus squamalis]